jgi:Protein of unknown function (DUF1236)
LAHDQVLGNECRAIHAYQYKLTTALEENQVITMPLLVVNLQGTDEKVRPSNSAWQIPFARNRVPPIALFGEGPAISCLTVKRVGESHAGNFVWFDDGSKWEKHGMILKRAIIISSVLVGLIAAGSAQSQGVPQGAADGAAVGGAAAGPVGAAVGGVVGGVAGGVAGILGVDARPRFHEYVVREHRRSYDYDGDVRIGAPLPPDGVEYYEVPAEYGVHGYRYTIINNRTVLVDPRTNRIVEVIN